jgi:hypothetical protein
VRVNPPFPPRLIVTLVPDRPPSRPGRSFIVDLPPGKAFDLILRGPTVRKPRTAVAAGKAGEVRDLGDLRPPPGREVTGRVGDKETLQ